MTFVADTLDDLMNDILTYLLKRPFNIITRKGTSSEIFGSLLVLKNPRARLSLTETKGKPFSALGELLWYLSEDNELDFIEYYIPIYKSFAEENNKIYGGYGPRIFNMDGTLNQFQTVCELLKEYPTSRKAVIQIFDGKDLEKEYKDIPCTCTLQFAIRDNQLQMITNMRSNDAFIGLPHDIFCFTMLQEILACKIGVTLGQYYHSVGSLHLYDTDRQMAESYLSEGYQPTQLTMPQMPATDPQYSIKELLKIEEKIRKDDETKLHTSELDPYWQDLGHLLKVHSLFKRDDLSKIDSIKQKINTKIYNDYIEARLRKNKAKKSD